MCVFPSEYAKSCTDRWWGSDLTMLASTMLHPRSTKVCAQILTALVKGYSAVHPDCCSAAVQPLVARGLQQHSFQSLIMQHSVSYPPLMSISGQQQIVWMWFFCQPDSRL